MRKVLPDNAIYFDNASTTPVHPEVRKLVNSLLETSFANSESLYDEGMEISRLMEKKPHADCFSSESAAA